MRLLIRRCACFSSCLSGRLVLIEATQMTSAPYSMLYFRHADGFLVPMPQQNSHDGCEWHVAMCAYAPCEGRQRMMVLHHQKISNDDGLMVHNASTRGESTNKQAAASAVLISTTAIQPNNHGSWSILQPWWM